MPEKKPLCELCRFAVPEGVYRQTKVSRGGVVFYRYECSQKGRGWLKTCPQYEREPGSDDE